MKNPKISVIMAAHDSENFLEESIESILSQTFKDFELIIIDDKSKDNSLKILRDFQKKDKRIKIIKNNINLGPAGTRNEGLKIARGKYVAILDSDDISSKKRLETQFNYLEKNPKIFLVGSSALFIDEKGNITKKFRKYDDYKMLSWRLPKSCGVVHSSVMFRNTQEFFYNENFKYSHDYNLYLDILETGKNITNLPVFLVKYRVHKNSVSKTKTKEQESFSNLVKEKHKKLRSKISFFDKIIFSIKLLFFYLKTFREKKGINK